MAFPDTWQEVFLISLERASGTDIQLASVIDPDSLEINTPDYPGEGLPNAAGGRGWKQSPQEDVEISFTINQSVDLDAGTAANVTGGLIQQYIGVSGAGAYDTAEPLITDTSWPAGVTQVRDRFRLAVLFTNDTAVTTAAGATAASTDSERFFCDNLRIVSHKSNFSDGYLKHEITLKAPAKNKAGTTLNFGWESGDNTALSALDTTLGAFA